MCSFGHDSMHWFYHFYPNSNPRLLVLIWGKILSDFEYQLVEFNDFVDYEKDYTEKLKIEAMEYNTMPPVLLGICLVIVVVFVYCLIGDI